MTRLNRKKYIINIFIAFFVFFITATLTVAIMSMTNKSTFNENSVKEIEINANKLRDDAIQALIDGDKPNAKRLFEKAKTKYEQINDKNGVMDSEMQIRIINMKNDTNILQSVAPPTNNNE